MEPQVGEERVFPVSHEVIHEEASDSGALLLCPWVDISSRLLHPRGSLGTVSGASWRAQQGEEE